MFNWSSVQRTFHVFYILLLLSHALAAAPVVNEDSSFDSSEQESQESQEQSFPEPEYHEQDPAGTPESQERLFNYADPHFLPQRTAIVQLFEWAYADVANECENFLGPKGFAGVQLSPVTEHLVVRTFNLNRPWVERYEPISYRLATRSGNESDFLEMSRACNAAGVRVYVEVVLNHMAHPYSYGATLLMGTADGMANYSNYEYRDVPYTREDFHQQCDVTPISDVEEVRNCQLDGRPDLDHSRVNVRDAIVELLNRLVDMGVAGFFINSAKHMWPNDIKGIFDSVKDLNSEEFNFPENARPLVYQDVLDFGMDKISKTEYTPYGLVTEYFYPAQLAVIFHHKAPLTSLINWGPAMGFVAHQDSVVFVDSPQGQRGLPTFGDNQLLTYRELYRYIQANVFMLAHPYGRIKRIMSSYYYAPDDVFRGPPAGGNIETETIRSPEFDDLDQCIQESGWVCEHRWEPITNIIELANQLNDSVDGVNNFQTDGPNHIAFCRGNKAFIAMNSDQAMHYTDTLHTCLEEGVYCDVITGILLEGGSACSGRRVRVNAEGMAYVELPPVDMAGETPTFAKASNGGRLTYFGVLAIHVGSKIKVGEPQDDAEQFMPAMGNENGESAKVVKFSKLVEGEENAEKNEAEDEAAEEGEAADEEAPGEEEGPQEETAEEKEAPAEEEVPQEDSPAEEEAAVADKESPADNEEEVPQANAPAEEPKTAATNEPTEAGTPAVMEVPDGGEGQRVPQPRDTLDDPEHLFNMNKVK